MELNQVVLYFDRQEDAIRFTLAASSVMSAEGALSSSSADPFVIAELARYTKMSEQIDKMFAGMPLNPNYPPDSSENQAR
jgi:hypothetical protein